MRVYATYVYPCGLFPGCVRGSWSTASCESCTERRRLDVHKDEMLPQLDQLYTSCTVCCRRLQVTSMSAVAAVALVLAYWQITIDSDDTEMTRYSTDFVVAVTLMKHEKLYTANVIARALEERIPPPRRIWPRSAVRMHTPNPNDFRKLMGTFLFKP